MSSVSPPLGTEDGGRHEDLAVAMPGQPKGHVRDSNETWRVIAMVGVIFCSFIQSFALAGGDLYFLATAAVLLFWFFSTFRITPLYMIFVGIMVFRLGIIARYRENSFIDFSTDDFLFHLVDSVSFVGLMAFGFIYFELAPQRLDEKWQSKSSSSAGWFRLEPFRGLLVRMPIAIALAILVYFASSQIPSPVQSYILAEQFARTYIVVLILFAFFLLCKTLIAFWSWRNLSPEMAQFYLVQQFGEEAREELNELGKPAWSKMDHASAVGGMFLVQWVAAMVMAGLLVANAQLFGNAFMWPAVAALFVMLTAIYNSIRAARSNIVAEQHVITFVSFAVVTVVGLKSLLVMPVWPWRMLYLAWWAANGLVIMRMCYLWVMDEAFARKNNWETARPISVLRTSWFVIEGGIAGLIVYMVGREMLIELL